MAELTRGNPDSRDHAPTGNDISQRYLRLIRRAIDESGWKYAAVAAALDVEPAYLSRMLSGEKRWTLELIEKLPDAIEAIFARLCVEAFGGLVVEHVTDQRVCEMFVSMARCSDSFMRRELPDHAGPPLKASLPANAEARMGHD